MKTSHAYLACTLIVAITACDKIETSAASEPAAPASAALFTDSARTMVIVAHPDDDLGLLNPDLVHTIRAGNAVRTVMVTAGDANFPCTHESQYVEGRETGHLAGYAEMAQVPYDPQDPEAAWTDPPPIEIPGMPGMFYRLRTLIANPSISAVYLALPNDEQRVLETLWNDSSGTLSLTTHEPDSRRPTSSYTRAKLIDVLLWLMNDFQPTHISTLDSSKLWPLEYPWEHTDHLHSALFALSAAQRYAQPHTFRTYRTYNIMLSEPANVAPVDAQLKTNLVQVYGEWDAWFPNASNNHCPLGVVNICGVTDICQDPNVLWAGIEARQYSIAPVHGAGSVGGIAGPTNKCLHASGTTAGSTITLQTCNMASASQQFKMLADGTVRQKSSNLCVAAHGASAQARPRNIGLTLRACATPLSEHKFMLMTNGQLRGPDATCVHGSGSALSIRECLPDEPAQLGFKPQFASPPFGSPAGFADAQIPNDVSVYGSLDMADIDADGDADVCFRRSGSGTSAGIFCSTYNAGAFSVPTQRLAQFTNAQGYGAAQYGSTVQLADIDNDGRADVCGRSPAGGIYCAHWSGGTLGDYSRRTTAFGSGHNNIGYYSSIRFADVNADGYADVCGRNENGIECGLNDQSGNFGAPTPWLSTEFTNALGYNNEAYGGTIMFGDIDGDGLADVCGRGSEGIRCAIHAPGANSNAFIDPHLYGASDDFDDAGGWFLFRHNYGSLRLADINGDGRADICGRSMWGLHCGISMGSSFGLSQKMIPINPYDNATGWGQDRYGSTLMFGDLNGDGHHDVCARGPYSGGVGLRCAFAP